MKALILIADGMEDSEFFYPYYRMKEAGMEVEVAAPERGKVTGKHGYEFEADKTFAEAKAGEYEVLIIPGGKGPETVRLEEDALEVTREMMKAGKPVGAICHGAQVLISAGVVKGKKATCWKGMRDDLKAAGANYKDAEVVVDGNLVTSRCPADLPAFSREIFRLIQKGVKKEHAGVA